MGLMSGVLVVLAVALGAVFVRPSDQPGFLQGVITLAVVVVVEIAAAVLLYVLKLTVRVDAGGLHVRFFPLVKKDIPWSRSSSSTPAPTARCWSTAAGASAAAGKGWPITSAATGACNWNSPTEGDF